MLDGIEFAGTIINDILALKRFSLFVHFKCCHTADVDWGINIWLIKNIPVVYVVIMFKNLELMSD